jgi:TRAP-type transport system periplasmic protein
MNLFGFFGRTVLTTAVAAITAPATAQVATLRIESILPAAHAASMSMTIFKSEVARLSGGAIEVEVSAGSPRGLKETVDAVHAGSIFGTWTSISYFSRLVPEVTALSLPFIFDNYDEARRTVTGPVGSLIAKKLDAKGFTLLSWMDLGEFHVMNSKRPLRALDDFKGLKIRVMPNATHLATFQALGARPVPMDFKDLAAAVQQGDIDGEEIDYATTHINKFYEKQKYASNTRHFLDFNVLVANKGAFAGLNPMQQKAVREAAVIAAVQQDKMLDEFEAAALARLQEYGMQFDPLPPETRVALRQATSSVVEDAKKWVGADLVNKVLASNRVPVASKGTASDKGARR